MYENIQWIFSGVGTNIISLIVGCVIGYKFRDFKIVHQSQKSGENSNQRQEFHNGNNELYSKRKKMIIYF